MEALALIGDLGLNVVDDAEIAKCKAIFDSYDEDHDGKLTYAELLTCLRVCGGNPSVEEFKELVQVVDTKLVRIRPPYAELARRHLMAPVLACIWWAPLDDSCGVLLAGGGTEL